MPNDSLVVWQRGDQSACIDFLSRALLLLCHAHESRFESTVVMITPRTRGTRSGGLRLSSLQIVPELYQACMPQLLKAVFNRFLPSWHSAVGHPNAVQLPIGPLYAPQLIARERINEAARLRVWATKNNIAIPHDMPAE